MKLLNKLCCMQLRTATLVIGILGVVGASLTILLRIYDLFELNDYDDNGVPEYHYSIKAARVHLSINLVLSVISLITSICLILGVVKKNHLYLLPWLIQSAIGIFLLCLGIIFGMISSIASIGSLLVFIVLCGLALALSIYIFMGIYSYYISLIEGRRRNGQGLEY